uniref:Uncharacterized protein n=1 Tax=Manihot esculenta TaxID=3983 RepID=A0A2C9V6B8_MANES
MVYFTKLKKIWDELSCLRPFSACDCGASKVIISLDSDDKLIDSYDHVKHQVLLMDPLLSVNKAYSIVLIVEKQREVQSIVVESSESSTVLIARFQNTQKDITRRPRTYGKKRDGKKMTSTTPFAIQMTILEWLASRILAI